MTGALSPVHWAIVLVVVLLVFGAKRLPDAARGLGQSMRIFKAETAQLNEHHTDHTAGHGVGHAGENVPRAVAPGVAPDAAAAPTSAAPTSAAPAASPAVATSSGSSRAAEPTS